MASEAARRCRKWQTAKAVVDELGIPDHIFNPAFDICYCGECAALGGHDPAITRADRSVWGG